MMLVRTYLAPSPIDGIGVFAAEFIPGGTRIWELNPVFDVFIHKSQLAGLPPHMQEFVQTYSFPHLELPDTVVIDSDNGRFMNHSEMPNTDFTVFEAGFALRDIYRDEELTCNYCEFDPAFRGFPAHARKVRRRMRGRRPSPGVPLRS